MHNYNVIEFYEEIDNKEYVVALIKQASTYFSILNKDLIRLSINKKEIKYIYLDKKLLEKCESEIINTVLELDRIIKRHIILGENPPCYLIINTTNNKGYTIINIGFINLFSNTIDNAIINSKADAAYIDKSINIGTLEINKFTLPDNCELYIGKSYDALVDNVGHCKIVGSKRPGYYVKYSIDPNTRELIFDRLEQSMLDMGYITNIDRVVIKSSCLVTSVIYIVSNSISEVILNYKIDSFTTYENRNEFRNNDRIIVKTPLNKLIVNNVAVTYNEKDKKYYDSSNNLVKPLRKIKVEYN